ncbi:hypothetical protein T484DRAFT_1789865, partial [Baffinella frigidus]
EEGTSGEEDGDGAPVGGELDNFIRLRSYILHMQEGASLLLWREDGLQLCWFWIDKECVSLHWDIDEEPEGPGQPAVSGGGSILLQDIVDIVPLGAGPDQLTDHPTDSSFTITLDGARLDIVAPTSIDFQVWSFGLARPKYFQAHLKASTPAGSHTAGFGLAFATRLRLHVWYFGLAFATRLRLNVLNASQSQDETETDVVDGPGGDCYCKSTGEDETETDVDDGPGGDWYGRSPQSDGSTGQFGDAADDVQAQLRRGAEGDGITLGLEESQVMLDSMEEQRRAIENLKKENQKLREVRRSKDEAISRLLGDLQEAQQARDAGDGEAQQARDAGDEGQGEAKTPATSQESDRNWHNREIYRVRKRNQLLEEITDGPASGRTGPPRDLTGASGLLAEAPV